ncbi:hypothetical protein BDR07DRAFT_1372216 [Suillus spraguei]|nr:hypothetical protein BDR07DRAFT_1372216 [Suillus spraguei]
MKEDAHKGREKGRTDLGGLMAKGGNPERERSRQLCPAVRRWKAAKASSAKVGAGGAEEELAERPPGTRRGHAEVGVTGEGTEPPERYLTRPWIGCKRETTCSSEGGLMQTEGEAFSATAIAASSLKTPGPSTLEASASIGTAGAAGWAGENTKGPTLLRRMRAFAMEGNKDKEGTEKGGQRRATGTKQGTEIKGEEQKRRNTKELRQQKAINKEKLINNHGELSKKETSFGMLSARQSIRNLFASPDYVEEFLPQEGEQVQHGYESGQGEYYETRNMQQY